MADLVFLITGASSGFGKHTTLEALKRGHKVIATARKASRLSELEAAGAVVLDLDVTAPEEALDAQFKAANDIYGKITHVINCAGYILEGAVEEVSQAEMAATFATNVFGAANVSRAAAPYLRQAAADGNQCAIAHFGSLGSWSSGPAVALYCSTKFAVTGLTEGLAGELKPFGVDACVVEPGYFRTGFLNVGTDSVHRVRAARDLAVYDGTPAHEVRKGLEQYNNNQPGDVAKGARVIVDVLTKRGVAAGREIPVRLVLGSDCVEVIRQKIRETEKILEEWEAIARTTDY
ncbi:putative estradiol 17-beta-dehydrogenase protein [Phaeoacremonium minimum UCRPA7]|uniref:Putative estradiol 17-beta-dehydrogenase protein n=1 Tax=Phaeoacremonium minimum (strain UCR-PA7) TaxID=1286976 RepID=R8BNG7_PHAM7|nr:putative estradiol 17-beta-dehydrogenase protein [Phaeoacremonium minimum UCRPA7]EOO00869.1 putative estradiol 17-beta-dehydrogenase protein [Phaeoacremonium minimum UCRPA7]